MKRRISLTIIGVVLAAIGFLIVTSFRYQDLPMEECAWCHRASHLNRHHLIPKSYAPELKNVKTNLVVLCRDCHFVLAHRCNWKTYNPDLSEILVVYTNQIKEIKQ